MPELVFKGKVHVANHHLVVPFHELVPVKSKGLAKTPSLHDNLLLHGDNLLALKSLLPTHAGKIKCIYIDPPYNTGNEGWAYNDKVNSPLMQEWLAKTIDREDATRHDKWCCMMLPRLKLLRELLSDDGAIFVSIDDNEVHHLRCLMDEVFGEENFVANFVWQKRYSRDNRPALNTVHDHIVVYAKGGEERFKACRHKITPSQESLEIYRNPNDDPRGRWRPIPMTAQGYRPNQMYQIRTPAGATHKPPKGRCWSVTEAEFEKLLLAGEDALPSKKGRIWFGKDGTSQPNTIRYLDEVEGFVPWTWLPHEEVGHTDEAKKEIYDLLGFETGFDTPKPTRLLKRLFEIYTDKDSIILDSFSGSGTTGQAVMDLNADDGGSRRFILIECESYADTVTAERLRRCIKGVPGAKDEGLKKGYGGSFSFFKLGEPVALQTILESKNLPGYETLAAYVFFTATGEEFDPAAINRETGFIGRSKGYDVYLLYTPEIEALKELALDLETVRTLPPVKGGKERKRLVFAPTRFMDDALLHRAGIVFSQLPYEIYERVQTSTK